MKTHSFRAGVIAMTAALLALGAGAQASLAQTEAPAKQPALKGPEVKDRNVPGANPDFGMGANRRPGERVPPEVFRRALAALTADDAPADTKATDAQRAKFRELVDGFEQAARKYRQEHAKEMEALRKDAGDMRPQRPNAPPPPAAEPMQELTPEQQKKREESRVKLRELMEAAPKMEDVYTKVWTELSQPQRKVVQARLDEWREEQAKKREDDYVRRQMAKKDGQPARPNAQPAAPASKEAKDAEEMKNQRPDAQGDKPAEAQKPPARPNERRALAERRDRLLRMFEQMTPEEQDQLLQRLEQRLKDRPGNGPRRGEGRPGGPPKPPADPDKVNVPKPDDDKK